MHSKKKITGFTILFSILVLSFITSFSVAATTPRMAYIIDHSFGEEYWGVLYDFAGMTVEQDYTPGSYSGTSEGTGGVGGDNITDADSKFYVTYTNVGNVQSLYVAMQNFSWGMNAGFNESQYGCAPLQVLVQHFSPAGNPLAHVFVINRFLGLMAYVDNKSDSNVGIPNDSDQMFMGWAFYSGFHKHLINQVFESNGIPQYARINDTTQTTATPINITKTTTATEIKYSYGMSYKNLFVAWQFMNESVGAANTGGDVSGTLGKFVAASILKEVNFTYVTTLKNSSTTSQTVVETSVKYDIGNMTDLWVFTPYENAVVTQLGAGTYFSGGSMLPGFGYYNTTDSGIRKRLNGTSGIPGFSFGIVNSANIIQIGLNTGFGAQGNFLNSTGTSIGDTSAFIGNATTSVGGRKAYEIDFAPTKNYTLDGTTEHESRTLVIGKTKVETQMEFAALFQFGMFLGGLIGNTTGISGGVAQAIMTYVMSQLSVVSFYYVTCFPEWSGGTINQDPTFTAYTGSPDGAGIPGYEILFISLAGFVSISYVMIRKRRKDKKKIIFN